MFRRVVERWAGELLGELAGADGPACRVAVAAGGLACLVQVWRSDGQMPTARATRSAASRDRCRADVLAAVRAAGRPLTRKDVVRHLRAAGVDHGPGTVAKALADLTAAGGLVNPRDRHGYRLPEWVRPGPTLFEGL